MYCLRLNITTAVNMILDNVPSDYLRDGLDHLMPYPVLLFAMIQ